MAKPRVLILRAPGTNCDAETAFAFQRSGAVAEIVHINRLLEAPSLPHDYEILCIPGGFSYGDDIAAGRIFARQIRRHLYESLQEFKQAQKLILGICNGFQILIKSGILLSDSAETGPQATLTWNDSGHFEDRWVHLKVEGEKCVFLRDIEGMYLPIAHAEGKFVARTPHVLDQLSSSGQLSLCYSTADGHANGSPQTLPFPINPNGSQANVAGVCDETGRVFGLMPHPERFIDPTQHPQWTRRNLGDTGDGLQLFRNAVKYF